MSIAMAPEKAFTYLIIGIFRQSGIQCPMAMLEKGCFCSKEQYDNLASLKFNFVADETETAKEFEMPKQAYMSFQQQGEHSACKLMIRPWKFDGPGKKEGDDYWILGVQFLKNFYTIYDFKNKKVGLVESKTSVIPQNTK